jgi:hypothetical protein
VAHFDTRRFQADFVDRAPPRAAATWHAVAVDTTATSVVTALVVGTLVIVEAAILPARQPTEQARVHPEPARWRASAHQRKKITTACTQFEPASCVTD